MGPSGLRRNGLLALLFVGFSGLYACKDSSSGRLGSTARDTVGAASGTPRIRVLRGQLDFDLAAHGGVSPGQAPAAGHAGRPDASSQGAAPSQPIRVQFPAEQQRSSSGQQGTVRMEFSVVLDEPVGQLADLPSADAGNPFRRVGTFSTSNVIHEPQQNRFIGEEVGRALYLVHAEDCSPSTRCMRLMTGGPSLSDDKERTLLLELREAAPGRWVLKGFRYFGHATVTEYGMPVNLVLTDRFDG